MKNSIRIPVAMQIRVDDVGWHNAADERHLGRPSRSGFPRNHLPEDYLVLDALGRALDMKIGCSLVLGEWDKNNRLRGVPHVTWDEQNWNRAAEMDMDYAEKCFANLSGGEYLEYNLHGLLHSYYEDGKLVSVRQYYPFAKAAAAVSRIPPEEFRRHLELFFEIYNDWGFTKTVRSFASPCGAKGLPEENAEFAAVLREFGITTWMNGGWGGMKDSHRVVNGVICEKAFGVVPWDAYDIDPRLLKLQYTEDTVLPQTDFCLHWTNFLRYHPEHNMERLGDWVDYFRRHGEIFGVMLSKDTAFAASQGIYCRYAKTEFAEGKCIIDFSDVDALGAAGLRNEFFISMRNGTEPKACDTAMELYETKENFKTYKITRSGNAPTVITL